MKKTRYRKTFKVEMRTTCKMCGKELPNAKFRTFCSKECRNRSYNIKQAESGYSTDWAKAKRDKIASVPDENKCQCLICGKWYVQVGSHVRQVHGMTAREYREYFDLEVKRGTTPKWFRKMKGDQALKNGTYKNLDIGAKYRFKKGQKGVGKYERSPITLERLSKLYKLKKS